MVSEGNANSAARWRIFPEVIVRTAGLPYSWLSKLQAIETASVVRRLLALEREMVDMKGQLLLRLAAERRAAVSPLSLNHCRRAEQRIKRWRTVSGEFGADDWRDIVAHWNRLAATREALLLQGKAAWEREKATTEQQLRDYASDPAMQEAVLINSPQALSGVRRYAAKQTKGTNYQRRVLTQYLQRCCAKNETASFFGPINYARVVPGLGHDLALDARADGRAARRQTHLSYWAAQALARTWARAPGFAPYLRLYRNARLDLKDLVLLGDATDRAILARQGRWAD